MGKKIGNNPKAAAARERNNQKKTSERERALKEAEDAKWVDDDKQTKRKLARKVEKENKRLEDLARKKNIKSMEEEELRSMKGKDHLNENSRRTFKEIYDLQQKRGPIGSTTGVIRQSSTPSTKETSENTSRTMSINEVESDESFIDDIPENINRQLDDTTHAKGVEAAIDLLQRINIGEGSETIDRHPEKRQQAAFKAFEERETLRLRAEEPTMTFSQRKQYIFKMWQKSPENPMLNR